MLEPTSPAGEPFESEGEENSRMTADFEQVCTSLVERGWKILPKKGSYPINKQGPRYINLVDPRGNRKSIRVLDSALWERLRLVESTRSKKKTPSTSRKHTAKGKEAPSAPELISESIQGPSPSLSLESSSIPLIQKIDSLNKVVFPPEPSELAPQPFQPTEIHELPPEVASAQIPENQTGEPLPAVMKPTEEIEKNPASLETFTRSRLESQKSIFEMGLDSLINALRTEPLSPSEIIQRMEDWIRDSKNLIEYEHKLNEPREIPVHLDSEEKEAIVVELQATLKETEDKLAALIRSAREI